MSSLQRISRALFLAVSLVACASDPSGPVPPVTPDPEAVERVDENLERLRALEVFEVGALVVAEGATEAEAATRLDTFAGTAEGICQGVEADASACTTEAIEANLADLRAMSLVEVGDLLVVQPENDPNCYNLPCPEDREAAEAETCLRATKLARIVAATHGQY